MTVQAPAIALVAALLGARSAAPPRAASREAVTSESAATSRGFPFRRNRHAHVICPPRVPCPGWSSDAPMRRRARPRFPVRPALRKSGLGRAMQASPGAMCGRRGQMREFRADAEPWLYRRPMRISRAATPHPSGFPQARPPDDGFAGSLAPGRWASVAPWPDPRFIHLRLHTEYFAARRCDAR